MKLLSKLALAAALAVPVMARAESPNTGALTFSGGFDVVSAYYFRGYLQENQGLIFQPYFGASFNAVSTDDVTVDVSLSTWNSFHSENTGSDDNGTDSWYENDINLYTAVTLGKVVLTPIYQIYQSPNGAFETTHEIGLQVGYDDTGLYTGLGQAEDFGLNPYVGIYYEVDDKNGSEDGYIELGITPSWTAKVGDLDVPVEVPIILGLSYDEFFTDSDGDNEVFGFAQIGLSTSLPLPIPEDYGAWSLNLAAHYQYLMADSLQEANNDGEHVVWGRIGLSFEY